MFYVSYITEYPIYEPAEGGYYYAGEVVEDCREFSTWKKANKCYQQFRKEFLQWHEDEPERINDYVCGGIGRHGGSAVSYYSRYIGEGERVEISKKRPQGRGYEPYC